MDEISTHGRRRRIGRPEKEKGRSVVCHRDSLSLSLYMHASIHACMISLFFFLTLLIYNDSFEIRQLNYNKYYYNQLMTGTQG